MVTNWAAVTAMAGDLNPSNNWDVELTIVTDTDGDGIPNFIDPDDDNDCMPDFWEVLHAAAGLNPLVSNSPLVDFDGDGLSDVGEYTADTIPTDSNSVLRVLQITTNAAGFSLQWQGGVVSTQYLEKAISLLPPFNLWSAIFTNLPPTSITNIVIDVDTSTNNRAYYRIRGLR